MAAGGYKEFVAGETLDQDEINDYLMQGMLVFAGTAARGSAITAPVEGQFTFLTDTDSVEFYDGTAWVELSTTPGAAVVSGTTGSPGTATSGGYDYYAFTGDGSITVSEAGFMEVMCVAGGGGGGNRAANAQAGGGGGAGGVYGNLAFYIAAGTYTVEVGAGGAQGINGEPSRIGAVLYGIGGGAGLEAGNPALSGGSGGGGRNGSQNAVGVVGQGFDGGVGDSNDGGGGGGAGEAGDTDAFNQGGDGTAAFSVWGIATSTGEDVGGVHYFAGGGGGGDNGSGTGLPNPGGDGGGGAGAQGTSLGENGDANTGGGGGGSKNGAAGSGGSGIVIVRVAV